MIFKFLSSVQDFGSLSMKPNYEGMTFKDLRAYVLEHRDDLDALRFLFKVKGKPDGKVYGIPHTPEEWKEQEEAIRQRIKKQKS
jgi:hypothetical protein